MPDPASRLPARPSLDQLRKQAKELLKHYRAGHGAAVERFRVMCPRLSDSSRSDEVTLADAQFVLAREYGFESWATLKHHIDATKWSSLLLFEQLAEAIVSAYRTGDDKTIKRIQEHYQRGFTWEQLRGALQHRLRMPADSEQSANFTLADAQLLIANEYGFEGWQEFAVFAKRLLSAPRSPLKPPLSSKPYEIDWRANKVRIRQVLGRQDMDAVVAVMKEKQITGLATEGLMTDRLIERLLEVDHLTDLEAPASKQLTDAGLKHLARLPRLKYLDLSGCRITDRGLEVLRQLRELRTFKLHHQSGVSDRGLSNLRDCDDLESVELLGTSAGDGTIKALIGKPRLRHFQAGNDVTDDGLALLHEFPVFKTWQGGEPEMSLMSPSAGPNFLWLNLQSPFTNKGLATLAGLDGLFALSLFGRRGSRPFDSSSSRVTPAGLRLLAALPRMGWLGCTGELCNDEAMQCISAMPRLRMLMCQDTVAGDEGFAALTRSQSINYLWGRRCHNLTGRGFAGLAAMPALCGLSVSCKNVDDRALSALPRFSALKEFMPIDVPDEGFRHVGGCAQLEALWCMYCRDTTDAATAHIGGLSNLKTYYAGATKITDLSLEILGRITSLERVTLYACFGITDHGIAALARLPRLREVTLESLPNMTPDGAAVFPANVRVSYS